jgi:hypothetical protein
MPASIWKMMFSSTKILEGCQNVGRKAYGYGEGKWVAIFWGTFVLLGGADLGVDVDFTDPSAI